MKTPHCCAAPINLHGVLRGQLRLPVLPRKEHPFPSLPPWLSEGWELRPGLHGGGWVRGKAKGPPERGLISKNNEIPPKNRNRNGARTAPGCRLSRSPGPRCQVGRARVCARTRSRGQGQAGMGRDGQGWEGMGRDGQGRAGMGRDGQRRAGMGRGAHEGAGRAWWGQRSQHCASSQEAAWPGKRCFSPSCFIAGGVTKPRNADFSWRSITQSQALLAQLRASLAGAQRPGGCSRPGREQLPAVRHRAQAAPAGEGGHRGAELPRCPGQGMLRAGSSVGNMCPGWDECRRLLPAPLPCGSGTGGWIDLLQAAAHAEGTLAALLPAPLTANPCPAPASLEPEFPFKPLHQFSPQEVSWAPDQ